MKPSENETDSRLFPRIPNKVTIQTIELAYPPLKSPMKKCVSRNISEGGICFLSAIPYSAKTVLNLNIHIKGWQSYKKPFSRLVDLSTDNPLTAIGEVMWCKTHHKDERKIYELGVKFINIAADDYRALSEYLKTLKHELNPS